MVLDTGSPFSSISDATHERLARHRLLAPTGERRFLLRNVTIQGQQAPDVTVRLSRRVTQVGAEGILGLDFLAQFQDIHFHVPTMRLTLSR